MTQTTTRCFDAPQNTIHSSDGGEAVTEERGAPTTGERGAPVTEERGATIAEETGTETSVIVEEISVEEETHNYNLRNRSELSKKTTLIEQFDNPASSKNYEPHLQFFQKCNSGMVEDLQKLYDHLCDLYERVVDYSFNQMSAKDGIQKHGQEAVMALFKKFAQLHDKRVFKAIRASDLSREQKRNALHAINLIKEKRNGILKGRTVADGRKQRQ